MQLRLTLFFMAVAAQVAAMVPDAARTEFAKYYHAVTGRAAPMDAVSFVVDPAVSKTGNDAYSIRSAESGTAVTITGSNARSVLYGVYDLLERRAGCHWFWDGDIVPKKETIDLSGLDVHEEARFEYRGIRYFAHRGLTRFQAEHWGLEDWKKEIDWMLKRRLNVFMLRIGQDDLFQLTFPDVCAYPDPSKPLPGAGKGYDDRSLFWSLQFRGEMRRRIQAYAFERGLMVPEDFGTMTHWYSRTPKDFLEKMAPPFLPQATSGYSEKNGRVWDIRDEKWADEYWKLTRTAVDTYGKGAPQKLLHTIGLGERRCYTNRQDNFNLKIEALDKFLTRAHRDYPDAKVLLAGWDFYFTWLPDEVKALIGRLDPKRDIIWDYEGDAIHGWRKEIQGLNIFTKWGVVGKFPYTYSIFLAYESALDARANYPIIEERQRIVQNDPACVGYIFWPESSHTDTLCLRYFTANAWSKDAVPHEKVLDEFCKSRYGALAVRMKAIWEKALPASMLRDWDANYGRLVTKHGRDLRMCDEKVIQTWKRPVEAAQGVFGELAEIPWSDEFLRRDTIDIARMVLDRVITLRTLELVRDVAAWRGRADAPCPPHDGADLPERARRLAALCDMMADLLELHTDYSLWESFLRLDAVEKVRNPDFPKTLFDNASCGYCRSHQYELARHWYAPRMTKMAARLSHAIAAGDRKAVLFDDPETERLALMDKPLESLKPMQPRTWERYRAIMHECGRASGGNPALRSSAVAAPGQFCSVVKSEGSPVIDGSRDALYDAAYPIDGLSHPRLLSLARERTSAKFLHDGTCLYGFIRCEDPNVANMPAWSAKRDDASLWKGDAIELFFVAKDGLKHFIISPTGGVYDAAGHPDDANTWMFDVKWNSGIKWAVSRDDASWSVEFSLPLSDIPGRDMAFNLVRDSTDARKCASWSRLADSAKWIYPADKTESAYGRIRFIDSAPGGFDFKCPPTIRPDKENYCLVRLAKDIPTDGFRLCVQGKDQKPWGSFASGRFGWTYNLDMKAKGEKDVVFTVEDGGELRFRQVSAIPAGYIMIRPSNLARGKLYLNSNRGLKAKLNWDCKHNYEGARMSNGGQVAKPFDIVFRCPPGVEVVSAGVRQEGECQVQHQRYAYLYPDYFSTKFATTLPAGTKGSISYSARYEDGVQSAQNIDFEVIDVGVAPKLKKFDVGHYNLYVQSLEDAKEWAETGVNSFAVRGYSDKDAALARSLTANGFKVVRGGYFWPGAVAGHSPWAVWTREDETARAKDINGRDIPLGAGLQISPSYRGRFFVESCRKEAEFCRKAGIYRFNFDIEDYIQKKGELGDFRPETIAYFKRRWAERHPGEPIPEPKVFERDPSAHPREHEVWVDSKCELWADFFREMKRLLSEGVGREVIFTDWSFNVFQTVENRNHSLRNADFYRIFDIREHGFYSSIDRDVRQLERVLEQFRQTFPGVKQSLSWCPSPVRYSIGRDSSDYYWSTMPAIKDEIVYSMYEAATFGCKGVCTFKAPMIDIEFHRQFIAALNVLAKVEDIVVDGESRSLDTNFPNDAEVYDKFFGRFNTWRNQRRVFCRANTLGGRTLISVSEYRNRGPMDVVVKFPHCGTVTVTDLESGELVATLTEGDDALKVPLRDRRCRLLLAE